MISHEYLLTATSAVTTKIDRLPDLELGDAVCDKNMRELLG